MKVRRVFYQVPDEKHCYIELAAVFFLCKNDDGHLYWQYDDYEEMVSSERTAKYMANRLGIPYAGKVTGEYFNINHKEEYL